MGEGEWEVGRVNELEVLLFLWIRIRMVLYRKESRGVGFVI